MRVGLNAWLESEHRKTTRFRCLQMIGNPIGLTGHACGLTSHAIPRGEITTPVVISPQNPQGKKMGMRPWDDPTEPPVSEEPTPALPEVTPSIVYSTVEATETVTFTPSPSIIRTTEHVTVTPVASPSPTPTPSESKKAPKVTTKTVFKTVTPQANPNPAPQDLSATSRPLDDEGITFAPVPSVIPAPNESQPQIVIQVPDMRPVANDGSNGLLWAMLGFFGGVVICIVVLAFIIRRVLKGK